MADNRTLTYAALVTITLPNSKGSASLTVTLAPADEVATDGFVKPLRECTLADLQVFADALEAEVWDAYEAITLLDLEEKEEIDVTVLRADSAAPVEDWAEHVVVLHRMEAPVEEAEGKETSAEGAEAVEAGEAERAFVADDVTAPPGEAIEPESEGEEAEPMEEATAAESAAAPAAVDEPAMLTDEVTVHEPAPEAEAASETVIAPSKARVRVAGQQLMSGHPTWAAVDVLVDEPALRAAQAHALSSLNREVAGVLVGPRPEKQPDGRYVVHVIDTIVAKHTVMQGASVTYTPESWRYLNDTLNERYPDESAVMVGWYHTHPGFGIFLSGMDLFIHQNFFTQIWHIAYVLDPRARTSGFFCWDRQKSRVDRYDFAWPSWAAGSW